MSHARTQTPHRHSRIPRYSPTNDDSPSRQLLRDLERALGQMQIHEAELQKVRAYNRRSYIEDLDARDLEATLSDVAALDAATARHNAVRQQAEATLQQHLREVEEAERRRKEEEERQLREKLAREKAERQLKQQQEEYRRAKIEQEKVAASKKAAEDKAKAEAEQAKRKRQEASAAEERLKKERSAKEQTEKDRVAKAAADEKAAQNEATEKATRDAQAQSQAVASASSGLEGIHSRYLAIHTKLKTFRKDFAAMAKTDPQLKPKVGDMRRAMKVSVGQLTDDKNTNKKATDRVKLAVSNSLNTIPSPAVQLSEYIATPLADSSASIPSLTLYLLAIFSKAVLSAFVGECAVNPRAAEPIGTLTAQVFSLSDLQYPLPNAGNLDPAPTTSLIDILLSKLHVIAPQLFGISAPTNTAQGRMRIGWRREFAHDGDEGKSFVSEQRHLERLTGLGAGYSSIALRNFSRTRLRNPYSPNHFWESMANIVNTPVEHVEAGHLVLLKNMLDGGWERVILFFGNVGVAALREACIEFPKRLRPELRDSAAGRSLGLMVETWEKEKNFRLT